MVGWSKRAAVVAARSNHMGERIVSDNNRTIAFSITVKTPGQTRQAKISLPLDTALIHGQLSSEAVEALEMKVATMAGSLSSNGRQTSIYEAEKRN